LEKIIARKPEGYIHTYTPGVDYSSMWAGRQGIFRDPIF
jgi:hypothetical protein